MKFIHGTLFKCFLQCCCLPVSSRLAHMANLPPKIDIYHRDAKHFCMLETLYIQVVVQGSEYSQILKVFPTWVTKMLVPSVTNFVAFMENSLLRYTISTNTHMYVTFTIQVVTLVKYLHFYKIETCRLEMLLHSRNKLLEQYWISSSTLKNYLV